jgi:hypothetical protein
MVTTECYPIHEDRDVGVVGRRAPRRQHQPGERPGADFIPAAYGYWVTNLGDIQGIDDSHGHGSLIREHLQAQEGDAPFWVQVALENGWVRVFAPAADTREMAVGAAPALTAHAARGLITLIRTLPEYGFYQINDRRCLTVSEAIRSIRTLVREF